jgi:hypothetical protein
MKKKNYKPRSINKAGLKTLQTSFRISVKLAVTTLHHSEFVIDLLAKSPF